MGNQDLAGLVDQTFTNSSAFGAITKGPSAMEIALALVQAPRSDPRLLTFVVYSKYHASEVTICIAPKLLKRHYVPRYDKKTGSVRNFYENPDYVFEGIVTEIQFRDTTVRPDFVLARGTLLSAEAHALLSLGHVLHLLSRDSYVNFATVESVPTLD